MILTAIMRSFIKLVDNKGVELPEWEYKNFINAMFSGNPGVNLCAIERRIRERRKWEEGL
jgi:hypothetical protein